MVAVHVGQREGLSFPLEFQEPWLQIARPSQSSPQACVGGESWGFPLHSHQVAALSWFRPSVALEGVESFQGSSGPQPSGKVMFSGRKSSARAQCQKGVTST